MSTMREAFEKSGVLDKMQRPEIPPYKRWWQHFRLAATVYNIPVFVKVECEQWKDGLRAVRERNLNKITTRCKDEADARRQLESKLKEWDAEDVLTDDKTPRLGALLYWRIYDS